MSFVDDSLPNTNFTNLKTRGKGPKTSTCQGCSGDPDSYKRLVGETCPACKGSGERNS